MTSDGGSDLQRSYVRLICSALPFLLFFIEATHAASPKPSLGAYTLLSHAADSESPARRTEGWGFLIGGSIALLVSVPGYFLTKDLFSRIIYSTAQGVGVASMGYGAALLYTADDLSSYRSTLDAVASLSNSERDALAFAHLEESSEKIRASHAIRSVAHGITMGFNALFAFRAEERELKTALFFLSGVNAVAMVHFITGKSETEKAYEEALKAGESKRPDLSPKLEFFAGPVSGVQIRF